MDLLDRSFLKQFKEAPLSPYVSVLREGSKYRVASIYIYIYSESESRVLIAKTARNFNMEQ